jgi:DNA-binding response OmpR family regulator
MRVLIVEDNPLFRIPLRATLARQGFDVQAVDSAESAEAVLAREPVDVVLTDIGLPGVDGVTLATRYPDVPFVFMTGSPPPEPGPPRLLKPFEPAEAVAVLRAAVRRHQGAHHT